MVSLAPPLSGHGGSHTLILVAQNPLAAAVVLFTPKLFANLHPGQPEPPLSRASCPDGDKMPDQPFVLGPVAKRKSSARYSAAKRT